MKRLLFFKGVSWLILLNIIIKPLWIFAIDRQVQNVVGHEEYGIYFSLLNLSIVFSFISDAGISSMLNRQLALQQQINIKSLFRLKCALALVYIGTLLIVAWLTGISRWEILVLVVILQVAISFLLFFRSILTANQRFSTDAYVSVMDKALMILFCGPLLYVVADADFDIWTFLLIQIGCTLITIVFAFRFILKKELIRSFDRISLKNIFTLIAPFAVIILLMSAHYRIDGFLLERIRGPYEAGIYASAFRLLDAGSMAGYLIASFLVPFVARNSFDQKLVAKTVSKISQFLLPTGVAAAILIIIFSPWIMNLLYLDTTNYQVTILKLSIAVLPALYLTHIYGSVLTAKGLFSSFIKIILVSFLLNFSINILLIHQYGALASCAAAFVSQYICGLSCWVLASKNIKSII
ncbi:MAG: oligosaccharide flippase family protein [Chitinophagaceae bacterium]